MLKVSFFPQIIKKDNTSLRLPNLNINGFTVQRESSINLAWRDPYSYC